MKNLLGLVGFLVTATSAFACSTCLSTGPAVISYFKAECDACKKEMPELDKLYANSKGRYKVIGVSLDDKKVYSKFKKSSNVKYPTIRYEDWTEKSKYKAPSNIPMIVYVDKEGKVRGKGLGWFTAEYMRDQVKPLVDD